MLYWLLCPLADIWSPFNVFRYITFRTGLATVTAFLMVLLFGPAFIRALKRTQLVEHIREETPETHRKKENTPTMGGLLVVPSILISTLLWANPANLYVLSVVGATFCYSAIGAVDDILGIKRGKKHSLRAREKMMAIVLVSAALIWALWELDSRNGIAGMIVVPLVKDPVKLGALYIPLGMLLLAGSTNAVNLTDGLDGLAIGTVGIAAAAYTVFVYLAGHWKFADYLGIVSVPGAGELTVFTGSMLGASLGFLWYNCHEASLFMGDVGSLALGGAIGSVAMVAKQELALVVVGGIFVAEAVSVIIQVSYFKATGGKRVFRRTPLHHHFEELGWGETKVVVRFWIVAIVCALAGLATLKLR